jgi:dTDP-glucose 4,6-dehydratase
VRTPQRGTPALLLAARRECAGMHALVTGSAGFLGSRLTRELTSRGHRVVGVDNFLTGSLENWREFAASDRSELVVADVAVELPDVRDIDVVFHFASPASPRHYAAYPLETMRVNAAGLERCCDYALVRNARLIFASTSEIYGDPLVHPQSETYWGNVNSIGPRACYDESKRYGEALLTSYRQTYGLDGRIVRIFNTYGPGMRSDDGRMVPAFVTSVLRGEPMPIYGGGGQTRSLCYVDDLVRGVVDYATLADPAETVMNLGNDEEYTVLEIAELVSSVAGVALRTVELPLPTDDPSRRCPDLRRARALIGWQPATSLREGLARTIAWYKAASCVRG